MAAAPKPAAAGTPPTPVAPRTGEIADRGAMVRESVRARSWRIVGRAKVAQSVELDELALEGDLSVAGSLSADRLDARGHLTVLGEAKGEGSWNLAGEGRFGSSVSAGSWASEGRLDVATDLVVRGDARVRGTLDAGGGVRATALSFDGSLAIAATLEAPELRLTIRGASKVERIVTRRLVIERPSRPWVSDPPKLEVLEIEGEEVRLSGVVAQHVRADRIHVGPGTQIAELEGTVVSKDPKSHVGPQVKSPRPHGLTR